MMRPRHLFEFSEGFTSRLGCAVPPNEFVRIAVSLEFGFFIEMAASSRGSTEWIVDKISFVARGSGNKYECRTR